MAANVFLKMFLTLILRIPHDYITQPVLSISFYNLHYNSKTDFGLFVNGTTVFGCPAYFRTNEL